MLKEHKDRGIFVDGLSWDTVRNIRDIERAMDNGTKHRVTKGTDMNATSSRSHAIFTICIEASETKDG